MPDNDKMSLCTISSMVTHKSDKYNNSEELLSATNSDSESGSTTSLKSPGHSPGTTSSTSGSASNGGLTLEQFTEIVLAQERMDRTETIVPDDVPSTIDDIVDKRRDITINNRHEVGKYTSIQTGAKLKPVVLTPRHVSNVSSHVSQPLVKQGREIGKMIPFQDRKVRDEMRKQLEIVIKKNEEILENSNVTHVPRKRTIDLTRCKTAALPQVKVETPTASIKPSMPLNLSVRKDLMKPKTENDNNVNGAIEKLLARHGRELEITRKSRKEKLVPDLDRSRNISLCPPPIVNMTPIPPNPTWHLSPRPEPETRLVPDPASRGLKRVHPHTNNNSCDVKKIKPLFAKDSIDQDLSVLKAPENEDKVKKIMGDFQIALQDDLNGNYPLHNAVLMSNVKLVKRFSTVLSALKRSLDLLNRYGETPLHLAVKQNKPNIVSELLHSGAAPSVTTTNGDSSYHLAVRLENSDCLAILLKHTTQPSDLNIFNDLGETCLHQAASSGDGVSTKMLLAAGANPDIQCAKSGKTGLYLAVEGGHQAVAETMLCYGANLTTATYSGSTPASLCSDNRKITVCSDVQY